MAVINHILLVDDDPITNQLHRMVFARAGIDCDVHIAGDGKAALEFFGGVLNGDNPRPDVVLLDINMPRMDGFEFLERYKQLPSQVRDMPIVVMISTSLLDKDAQRARSNPCVADFMDKPLQAEDLAVIVNLVAERREITRSDVA